MSENASGDEEKIKDLIIMLFTAIIPETWFKIEYSRVGSGLMLDAVEESEKDTEKNVSDPNDV